MKTRFYNGRILTMEDSEIFSGEVWIEGNEIVYVGDKKDVVPEFNREINLEGNLLMPGFKNAHTHSAMTFLRSKADDLSVLDWLNSQVFPMEAKLKEEDVYLFSILGIMEYLTSGITSNFDMYKYPKAIAKASKDIGFRTVICGAINDFNGSISELEEDYIELNNYNDLISFRLGFHAEYTTSDNMLRELGILANKLKAPVYTHNSESYNEFKKCLERTGKTPTERIDGFGVFEYGGGAYHCVHITENDVEIIKKKGIHVVTNPGSNCKLASGIAPIEKLISSGINVSIGTDGPASNNSLDMFKEMFLATGLQKIKNKDASALDADKVLKMATVNGSNAMGIENTTTISEGKIADLIVIDLNQPNMQPLYNISKNLVYSGSKLNVKMTMVDGKILYENGKFFIGLDPIDIYKEVKNRVEDLEKR